VDLHQKTQSDEYLQCSTFVSNAEVYIDTCKEARTKTNLTKKHVIPNMSFYQPKAARFGKETTG
jgi:hypothetical protein